MKDFFLSVVPEVSRRFTQVRFDLAHLGVASSLATASTDLSTAWFLYYVLCFPGGDF